MAMGPGYKKWPDHKVVLTKSDKHVRVIFNGEVIADSKRTIIVDESGHSIVYYFPCEDVRMVYMQRTNHHTYCPFKGEALTTRFQSEIKQRKTPCGHMSNLMTKWKP